MFPPHTSRQPLVFPVPQSVPCAWRKTPEPHLPLSDLPASACSAALCYDEPTKIKECKGSGRHQMSLYDIKFLIFGIKKEIVRSQLLRKGKVDRRLVLFQPDTLLLYFGRKSEWFKYAFFFLISVLYFSFTHPLPPFVWLGKLTEHSHSVYPSTPTLIQRCANDTSIYAGTEEKIHIIWKADAQSTAPKILLDALNSSYSRLMIFLLRC